MTRHRQQFAAGVFAQEAAAARIEALCRLGDREPAAAQAAFRERWPASPLHAWVRTLCVD